MYVRSVVVSIGQQHGARDALDAFLQIAETSVLDGGCPAGRNYVADTGALPIVEIVAGSVDNACEDVGGSLLADEDAASLVGRGWDVALDLQLDAPAVVEVASRHGRDDPVLPVGGVEDEKRRDLTLAT